MFESHKSAASELSSQRTQSERSCVLCHPKPEDPAITNIDVHYLYLILFYLINQPKFYGDPITLIIPPSLELQAELANRRAASVTDATLALDFTIFRSLSLPAERQLN